MKTVKLVSLILSILLFGIQNNYAQVSITSDHSFEEQEVVEEDETEEDGKEKEEEEPKKYKGSFDLGLDIYSRYIWRGVPYSTTPALQPGLSYEGSKGDFNFEIGTWGSYSFGDSDILEIDLFLSLGYKAFTFTLTDYFYPSNLGLDQFYNFKEAETGHTLETSIAYEGPDRFPITALFSYDIYGADIYNSYYVELAYPVTKSFSVAVGGGNGWHLSEKDGDPKKRFNITTISGTYEKEIKFTDKFSLPISGALILSPEWEKVYLVFGITI